MKKQMKKKIAKAEIPKTTAPKTIPLFSIGFSYLMWNENISISQAGVSRSGFANYAGLGIRIEQGWLTDRWFYGGDLGYAFGKTSSGGFTLAPTFPDGINRSWWAAHASVFDLCRVNPTFMGGFGLLIRYRVADWVPQDSTLTTDPASNGLVAAQAQLRWRLLPSFTVLQTFTPLNFTGSNLWTWSAQYAF